MSELRLLDHPDRVTAVVRLAAVPVFLATERLVDHPDPRSGAFPIVFAIGAAYALALAVIAFSGRRDMPPLRISATVDLLLLGLLTYTSGGPFSQLRYGFFVVPVTAALLRGPRATAIVSAAALASYLAAAASYPVARESAVAVEVAQSLFFVWIAIAAVLLSGVLARRQDQITALSADRGRLIARALEAEERERRRLAEALHDDAIQNLLAARQALGAVADAAPADLALVRTGLDRTVKQLRDAIFDLHPSVLRHAGLTPALNAVLERLVASSDVAWTVTVSDDVPSGHVGTVFAIARELIANAVRHAGASRIDVGVRYAAGDVVLTVSDDGRGLDRASVRRAPLEGHIGLASATERAEALGGRLEITSTPGAGSRIEVWLPAA